MADIFTTEKRSAIMRNIKAKDTRPELILRRALFKLGFRFRLHVKSLPGTPDLVLTKYQTVIFVNGCFWHGHDECRKGKSLPKTSTEFWQNKIINNQERDTRKQLELESLGWRVIVVYECQLKPRIVDMTIATLVDKLRN